MDNPRRYYCKEHESWRHFQRRYLRSSSWKQTRKRAIKAAKGRCQTCESKSELRVSHKTFARFGRAPIGDLQVLCLECFKLKFETFGEPDKMSQEFQELVASF